MSRLKPRSGFWGARAWPAWSALLNSTFCCLGAGSRLRSTVIPDWGTSPFQQLGAAAAAAAKSVKAKTAAIALVDSPLSGALRCAC